MSSRRIRLAAVAVSAISISTVFAGVADASPTYRKATAGPFGTQAQCEVYRASYNDPPDVYVGASCYIRNGSWFFDYQYRID